MSDPLDPQLAAFGQTLVGLAPVPPALDRDRLQYEAGRAAARPRQWGWLAAGACAVFAVSAWLPADVQYITEVRFVQRPVVGTSEIEEPSSPPLLTVWRGDGPRSGYVGLRNRVIAWGAEALPTPAVPTALPAPAEIRWKPMASFQGEI